MKPLRIILVTMNVLLLFSIATADQSLDTSNRKSQIQKIVIDPGRGGRNSGPSGCTDMILDKDINLLISKKIAMKVKKDLGFKAILTRETDVFVPLEERTAIANLNSADLFVSIQVNSSKDPQEQGIETFFLNRALEKYDHNHKASKSLAEHVQYSLVSNLKKKYGYVHNRGFQGAPFYVLMGASMPSVLVEAAYISNPQECNRLRSEAYHEAISTGIVEGIRSYVRHGDSKSQ